MMVAPVVGQLPPTVRAFVEKPTTGVAVAMTCAWPSTKLDLLIYKNHPYRWLDKTEQGFRFASDDELERVITIRHEEMQGLLDNPDARVERAHFGRSRAAVQVRAQRGRDPDCGSGLRPLLRPAGERR